MLIVNLLQPSFLNRSEAPLAVIFISRKAIRNTVSVLVQLTDCEREMQISTREKLRITVWEKMREIEGELFLLSARSGELDFETGHRFNQLCGERTKLASELLLNEHR